jgi:hypothetical protein
MTGPGALVLQSARRHRGPYALAGAALAAFGALSAARGDHRYWAFVVVLTALAPIVAAVDGHVRIPRRVAWMLATLGVLHLCGGLLPPVDGATFYETWIVRGVLKFDQAVHFYGSIVVTVLGWRMFGGRAVRAAAFGLAGGVLNEVVEMGLATRLVAMHAGSLGNTEWDLVFDVAGVVAAAAWLAMRRRANFSR